MSRFHLDDPRVKEVYLTDKQSAVMAAKKEGLSIRQIARLLNISESNVVYTVQQARLILNEQRRPNNERWNED